MHPALTFGRRSLAFASPVLAAIAITVAGTYGRTPQNPAISVAVYDQNPSHIWNRLYAALWVREDSQGNRYGEDSLDPMLWTYSEHLLSQPSHGTALRVLDEFLRTHAENLIQDPVRRAMLQRDLWSLFDWSVQQYSRRAVTKYGDEKRELQNRLAEVLRRLALTQEQIKALPNNYAQAVDSGAFAAKYDPAHPRQPFLPPDLFDPRGPWVCITPNTETLSEGGVAKSHLSSVSGRSVFLAFMRLPEGRKATMDYFQTLWNLPQPWVSGPQGAPDQSLANPSLPSFPVGTQVALVRQMILFDNQGKLVVSPIIESVQIRVYREITTADQHAVSGNAAEMAQSSGQDFFEIKISRPLLFSGKQGGLRATARDEREPPTFHTFGFDLIDGQGPERFNTQSPPTMQRCVICHLGGGITSFSSLDSLLKPTRLQQEPRSVDYGPRYWSESNALWWKENHYDWGLLNGYWKAGP